MKINHRLNAILIIGLTLGFGFTIAVVSAAPKITVTSAVPDEAEQGTTNLTVIINGRGFDNNMAVKFCRSETNETCVDGGVDVEPGSVEFISSKQLKVTVDVDVNANIGNNDIEVESLSSRRRGRGIEKFAVLKAGDPAPSGGGKAFLFEVKGLAVDECGGNTTDPLGASFGQVDWNENILWDPNFIHVHLKLQLKDVDPGTYEVFGNFDPACGTGRVDRPLCEGGVCDVSVTVKQSGKGRTSGVLRICPFQDAGTLVTVWLTVTVNGSTKILRSTPVTMVLPPNQVGSECS